MSGIEMTNLTNEGLAIEIKNLSLQIADLKTVIAQNSADYVKKEIFELRLREIESNIENTKLKIEEVRKGANKASWKTHTLTAIFTSVLVLLVSYVFNDLIRK